MRADVSVGVAIRRRLEHARRQLDLPFFAEQRPPTFDPHRKLVHVTEEVHHECVRGVLEHFDWRAVLLHAALVHHHHPIRDLKGFFLIVRYEDAGDVIGIVEAAQPGTKLDANLGIERAERFVQK